jgi:hypothetical protein
MQFHVQYSRENGTLSRSLTNEKKTRITRRRPQTSPTKGGSPCDQWDWTDSVNQAWDVAAIEQGRHKVGSARIQTIDGNN